VEDIENRARLMVQIPLALLIYNFEPEDIKEYGEEILQQLWYEIGYNNAQVMPE